MTKSANLGPLSPHLSIWSFTVSMAASITHRGTGVALYAGTLIFALWLASTAFSPSIYDGLQAFMGSMIGRVVLVGYSWAISFHLLNGLRYLFWDHGKGFEKDRATLTGWLAFAGSILLACILWSIGLYLA